MAYENLKAAIKQTIKQNDNQEITGSTMQSTLLSMVDNIPEVVQSVGKSTSLVMSQKAVSNNIEAVNAKVEAESAAFYMNMGGYIRLASGNIIYSPWSGYSDFIDIENVLELRGGILTPEGAAVAFYDKDKNYLEDISVPGNNSSMAVTITDDIRSKAKYARVSFYANTEVEFKQRRNLCVTKYVNDYRLAAINAKVEAVSNNIEAVSNNIEAVNAKVEAESAAFYMNMGGYIRLASGNIIYSPWSGYSDFIDIENVLELRGGILTPEGAAVAFYDKDKNYLEDISVPGNNSSMAVTITDDIRSKAKYARVSFYASTEVEFKQRRNLGVLEYINITNEIAENVTDFLPRNYCNLGIVDYQLPTADINHIAIYGQSLSTGQQGCPVISTKNFRGNLMVGQYEWLGGTGSNNKSGLNLLKARPVAGENYIPTGTSDQTNGETAALTFTNAAKALFDDYTARIVDRKFLDTSSGAGGNTIETLSKNYPPSGGRLYKNFTDALSTVKSLVDKENKSIVCTALVWMQGEWNETQHANMGWTGTDPATANTDDYQKMLQGGQTSDGVQHHGLINDMIDDVMATYGQENTPIVLGTTIGRGYHEFFENPIDMALLRASNSSNGKFVLVTPDYRVTDRNGHLDANGYRWCGEFLAKVWFKRVILKQNWHPLQPIKITKRDSTSILIEFNVPEPPLEFDIWQVKQGSNYGFSIRNNGNNVAIKSVEIYSPVEVMIKTSLELTGIIEIAYATAGNTYGNLRDSDKWIAFGEYTDLDSLVENPAGVSYRPSFEPTDKDGNIIYGKKYPMQNFCMPFYYKLDENANQLLVNI